MPPRAGRADSVPLRIRRIAPGEALGDVQRLRREVYFHERGQYTDRSKRVSDGLDGCGTTLVVERDAQAVATLRLHDFGSSAVQVEYGSLFELDAFARTWPLPSVAVATRFAVQADQRSKPVVDRLMEGSYRWAQSKGIRFCLLACEPYLHSVFEHYGFSEYLPPAILPGGVELLRMALVIDDAPHLQACNSPLQYLIEQPVIGVPARAWLGRAFAAARE
ncbi:N-acyl amino acid synthase FeeM domain-containing protein [Pseudoxanthomonas wuyuanensis]|uniref:N-acyl amino acid synthase FeeM domain-containing protein n=1 Tax=Pseudoxanthomonas wuyuanensis TaxID=1073196 RepID=UPI000BE223F0|nr:GNAT family N-acyltransferase [Pseudoxanthomonas wuyuanensis]KAF1720235.1 GNAT family N-acetyltransferase [Pseudoxanthomonas wuyuanensis]